jgi:phenylpropionate dioxygenase-like ring-hydroxylating dioxygenase large terminal subunit
MTPEWELKQLRRNIRLPELRAETWHGMVFATFDPAAPPLAPSLHRLDDAVRTHRIEDLAPATSVVFDRLPYNWKNMLENALEEYHTTYVHRGYHDNAPPHLVEHGVYEPGDGAVYRHAGLLIKGGEDVPGRPTFPVIEGLRERARGYLIFFAIPPALFAVVYPHGVKTFRVLPLSAGEIEMRISFLFPPSTIAAPGFAPMLERQVSFVELLDRPDIESNTNVFAGMKSRFAPRGPLGPQEATLPQLYQWILDRCGGVLTGKAGSPAARA